MILLIDFNDSFSYNLRNLICEQCSNCEVLRIGDLKIKELSADIEAIIFSPGPGKPTDYPLAFELFKTYYQSIPFLGVCLGFQIIAEFFGAKLKHAPMPMHGKVSLVKCDENCAMFSNIPSSFKVTRYHSLMASNIQLPLILTAQTLDNIPMAIVHEKYAIWAVQYHPEAALSEFGEQLIKNWLTNLK